MVSPIRAVLLSLLPGLTSSSSHCPPPFPAGLAQASHIPSSAVFRHCCWETWPRNTTQRQKWGGLCICCLHMPAIINVLQFCEFWWGCRVRKKKQRDRLGKMFSLEKKCRVDQNALTKYWFYTSPVFFLFLEKVSILSTFIAPFKYLSPGATTMEDEDNLSKQCFFFIDRWIIKCVKMKALPCRGNCGKEADMQILAGHKSSPHVKCKIPWCWVQIWSPVKER